MTTSPKTIIHNGMQMFSVIQTVLYNPASANVAATNSKIIKVMKHYSIYFR